ncbi:MAG: hypothetical protein EXS05_15355 [Planctomycetaceae bacterium]|nr:hypothetical protein [Planctomycetaceae bacterium]
MPLLLPGLTELWVMCFIGVLVARGMVWQEERVCEALRHPTKLRTLVETYLFSPKWWMQLIAVQRLSVVAGWRFGHLSLQPRRFSHGVDCWRRWWTQNGDALIWDDVAYRYVEMTIAKI